MKSEKKFFAKNFFIGIGKSALYILFYLGVQTTVIMAAFAGVACYFFVAYRNLFINGNSGQVISGFTNRIISTFGNILSHNTILVLTLSSVLTILGFYLGYNLIKGNFRNRVGLVFRIRAAKVVAIVLLGISMQFIVGILIQSLSFLPTYKDLMQQHENATGFLSNENVILTFICAAILAPITEEIMMRGLVYRKMKECSPRAFAIIFQAVIFGLIHGNLIQFLYATFLGIILALIYDWCGTLIAPILLHMSFNGFSTVLSHLPIDKLQNTSNMPVYLLFLLSIFVIGMIVLFPLLLVYIRKAENSY